MPFELVELSKIADSELDNLPNKPIYIKNIKSLKYATKSSLSFFVNKKYLNDYKNSNAAAFLVSKELSPYIKKPKLVANDPYEALIKIIKYTSFDSQKFDSFISEKACISASAILGKNTMIYPNTYVDENSLISDNVQIYPGVFVGKNVSIGDNVILYPNVTVHDNSIIGKNCILNSGSIIGSDGFGWIKREKGWIKVPQIGRTVLKDNCEVGSNTVIDRGTIQDTIISQGVKLDNNIQIGHNCFIDEKTIIAGCVGIAGSVHIGKECMIGGGVKISDHSVIEDNVTISGGTVVYGKLKKNNRYTGVFPILLHDVWKKNAVIIKKLKNYLLKL